MYRNDKAVIFDFDDTLVHTHEMKWAQHKRNAKENFSIEITDDDLRTVWGMPFDKMLIILYRNVAEVEKIKDKYFSLSHEYLKPATEGSLEFINYLISNNVLVGVITAMLRSHVVEDFNRLGFPWKRFFVLQGSDDTDFHKPDPRVFDPLLDNLKEKSVEPGDVLYIGDSVKDYRAANDAGLNFMGVLNGLTTAEEFRDKKIDFVESFDKLLDLENKNSK